MALITCKDCQKEFSSDAKVCPHCGAKKHKNHYILKGFMVLVFISWMMPPFAEGSRVNRSASSSIKNTEPSAPQWQYSSNKDDMTGKVIKDALIESTNTLSFEFPYQGIQHAVLELGSHPRYGRNVIFSIEKGQFLCRISECSVLVRFDDSPPVKFSAVGPADHNTTSIYISNYAGFTSQMLKAKKVRIEANFYHNGSQVLEFDVSKFDQSRYK